MAHIIKYKWSMSLHIVQTSFITLNIVRDYWYFICFAILYIFCITFEKHFYFLLLEFLSASPSNNMARIVRCSLDLYSKNYRRNAQEIEYKIFVKSKSKIFFSIIYKSKTKRTKFQINHTVTKVVNITIIVTIGFKRKIFQIVLWLLSQPCNVHDEIYIRF